jgi:hypothetical protein
MRLDIDMKVSGIETDFCIDSLIKVTCMYTKWVTTWKNWAVPLHESLCSTGCPKSSLFNDRPTVQQEVADVIKTWTVTLRPHRLYLWTCLSPHAKSICYVHKYIIVYAFLWITENVLEIAFVYFHFKRWHHISGKERQPIRNGHLVPEETLCYLRLMTVNYRVYVTWLFWPKFLKCFGCLYITGKVVPVLN